MTGRPSGMTGLSAKARAAAESRRAAEARLAGWTLAGAPVASVPCGFVAGMPVGLALIGRPSGDATVLRAAAAFQSATDWHARRPAHTVPG